MRTEVEKAIHLSNSQNSLADIAQRTQQTVSLWLKKGYVPHKPAVRIKKYFGEKISFKKLIEPDDIN